MRSSLQPEISPYLNRFVIGGDHIDRLFATARHHASGNYPPYDIEKVGENDYRVTLAVAGFTPDDLDVRTENGELAVSGRAQSESDDRRYVHKGIAKRAFERRFHLADHMEVRGASMENGLLHVELRREVPEPLKPKTIPIRKALDADGDS